MTTAMRVHLVHRTEVLILAKFPALTLPRFDLYYAVQ